MKQSVTIKQSVTMKQSVTIKQSVTMKQSVTIKQSVTMKKNNRLVQPLRELAPSTLGNAGSATVKCMNSNLLS